MPSGHGCPHRGACFPWFRGPLTAFFFFCFFTVWGPGGGAAGGSKLGSIHNLFIAVFFGWPFFGGGGGPLGMFTVVSGFGGPLGVQNWGWGACFRERKINPMFFRPKFFSWTSARHVRAKMLVFQDLEGLTKFLAGCPHGHPAENFLFGLIFCSDVYRWFMCIF